jgi:hypothetical protein
MKTKKTWMVVDKIVKDWDIASWVRSEAVMQDIKSAVEEAYIKGAIAGNRDKDFLEDAKSFSKSNY